MVFFIGRKARMVLNMLEKVNTAILLAEGPFLQDAVRKCFQSEGD